jgi:endonuclease/exonuclease/phosphatase family metal-dependent hydrolase
VLPHLRLMSYNVHRGVGVDGRLSLGRVAEVIRRSDAHVVALQEVDVGRTRTGSVDQPAVLAALVGMWATFGQTMRADSGTYGNAILSRWPAELLRSTALPSLPAIPSLEPRGAMSVAIETPSGAILHVVNTHLGLRRAERSAQMRAILEDDWLCADGGSAGTVMCGDFNCGPTSAPHRLACGKLQDVRALTGRRRGLATWPSFLPMFALDHVMVGPGIEVLDVEVPRDRFVRRASDHLPVVVTLRLSRT